MMKLLLDESVPRRLSASFPDSAEIITVQDMGWGGTKNGALLNLAADKGFIALITADKGFEYQHNRKTLPIAVIIVNAKRTRLQDLDPLVPKIVALLDQGVNHSVYHVSA